MYTSFTMKFSEWIVSELDKRGWSRSEAARRGDISPSMFDKVINGYSDPGIKFLRGLSIAFDIPLYDVFMKLDEMKKESKDSWASRMEQRLENIKVDKRIIFEKFIASLEDDDNEAGG